MGGRLVAPRLAQPWKPRPFSLDSAWDRRERRSPAGQRRRSTWKRTLFVKSSAFFRTTRSLRDAADELLLSGFDRSALSTIGREAEVVRATGRRYDRVTEIDDHPALPRAAYSAGNSRVEGEAALAGGVVYVAAVGAAAVAAAVSGDFATVLWAVIAGGAAGLLLGGVLTGLVHRIHLQRVGEQLRHGGRALFAEAHDDVMERKAINIVRRHGGTDAHAHNVPLPPGLLSTRGVSYEVSFMNALRL